MNRCLALKVSRQDHVWGIIKKIRVLKPLSDFCLDLNQTKMLRKTYEEKTFLECRSVQEV